MTAEPIQTSPNESGNGRPIIEENQYGIWLDDMRPFLRCGHSLNYAIEKARLTHHRTSIYEKSRENGWFSDKIEGLQSIVGEQTNDIVVRMIKKIHDKILNSDSYQISKTDVAIFKLAIKHRSSKPFFVSKFECSKSNNRSTNQDNIDAVLDRIELENYEIP